MSEPSKAAWEAANFIQSNAEEERLNVGGVAGTVQRAIDSAVSAERERCAVIAEEHHYSWKIVAAIRALPQVPDGE